MGVVGSKFKITRDINDFYVQRDYEMHALVAGIKYIVGFKLGDEFTITEMLENHLQTDFEYTLGDKTELFKFPLEWFVRMVTCDCVKRING